MHPQNPLESGNFLSLDQVQEWQEKLSIADATVAEQEANLRKAQLRFESEIDGVNTGVAQVQAKLA
jgi:hypothetical protein